MEISAGVQDEIKAHLDGQFISSTEACWKIFEFNMHRELPVVQLLSLSREDSRITQGGCLGKTR